MITVIVKRNNDPDTTQLTQKNILREIWGIKGSEMLLENSWIEGLKKVRTPYVCLVEADCTLSSTYFTSNVNLMHKKINATGKGGGYTKLAMLSSCLGVESFDRRIYNYHLEEVQDGNTKFWQIRPTVEKTSTSLYHVQVGFVPGAIIRYTSIKEVIDILPWDHPDLVQMSTAVSFHFWNTGRRVQINPNTTYVSNQLYLENPPFFDHHIPRLVSSIFARDFTLATNIKELEA